MARITLKNLTVIVIVTTLCCNLTFAVEVLDPAYQVEEYVSYASNSGWTNGMAFDSNGVLYVAYRWTSHICKITPDKIVTTNWGQGGLVDPIGIVWTSGTAYGDSLYVSNSGATQGDTQRITKISADGNYYTFSIVPKPPRAIRVDRTGGYGGHLFFTTDLDDRVYRVLETGESQIFCSYFYGTSGGIWGMDFDPGTAFGAKMYVGYGGTDPAKNGVFAVDVNGNATHFASDIVYSGSIGFSPVGGIFGGDLFVNGRLHVDDPTLLYRVGPTGNVTQFLDTGLTFTFGLDGAMYVHEHASGISTISRISLAPPPVTVYHVDAIHGSDSNDGLAKETAFLTIQAGIDAAADDDEVHVWPGVYTETINFGGKAIAVQSAADAAVLQAPDDFAVSCYFAEGTGSVLKNFVICNSEMAVFLAGSSPTLKNLTIVDNEFGISAYAGSAPSVTNCIFWNNLNGDLFQCQAQFSCLANGDPNDNNINAYPQFADPTNTDYHLKSDRGRFLPLPPAEQGWSEAYNHSELNDSSYEAFAPSLSNDERTIYFYRSVSGQRSHLVEAHRYLPSRLFTSERLITELYFGNNLRSPWVSSNGLRLYYCEDQCDTEFVLKMAKRDNINDSWLYSKTFTELHMNGYLDQEPTLTDDELTIYWISTRPGAKGTAAIWMATRTTMDQAFGTPINISELNTNMVDGNCSGPSISPDGKTIYFGSKRDGNNNGNIYKATKNSNNEPFSNMQLVPISHPTTADLVPYITSNEKNIYWFRYTTGIWFSEFNEGQWVIDDVTSPCIDAGDWMENPVGERMPNGGRVNMGAYGGTAYASMSEWPMNGDVNRDGCIDLLDFVILSQNWLGSLPWAE